MGFIAAPRGRGSSTRSPARGRENLDAGHVARYDTKEDAGAAGEVRVLQELGLDHRSTVVDIGAGTGQFTLAAASVCARVVAVDVSPVMLRRLQAKVDAAKASNVELVQSGFLSYEHGGNPADFVYSRYALHHLPDFWKAIALGRVRHILRPRGVLRLWDVVYSFNASDRSNESMRGAQQVRLVRRTSKVSGSGRSSQSMSVTSTRPSAGCSSR